MASSDLQCCLTVRYTCSAVLCRAVWGKMAKCVRPAIAELTFHGQLSSNQQLEKL